MAIQLDRACHFSGVPSRQLKTPSSVSVCVNATRTMPMVHMHLNARPGGATAQFAATHDAYDLNSRITQRQALPSSPFSPQGSRLELELELELVSPFPKPGPCVTRVSSRLFSGEAIGR